MYAPFMGGASALLGWLIEFFFFFPTLVLGKMEDVYAPVDKTAILVAAHKVVVGMSPPPQFAGASMLCFGRFRDNELQQMDSRNYRLYVSRQMKKKRLRGRRRRENKKREQQGKSRVPARLFTKSRTSEQKRVAQQKERRRALPNLLLNHPHLQLRPPLQLITTHLSPLLLPHPRQNNTKQRPCLVTFFCP